jgi:hypothetical protein
LRRRGGLSWGEDTPRPRHPTCWTKVVAGSCPGGAQACSPALQRRVGSLPISGSIVEFEDKVNEKEHQAPWSQTPDSLFVAFQATAVTAAQRLLNMNEAHHAASVLALVYLQYHEFGAGKPSGGYAKRLEFIEKTFGIDLSCAKEMLPELLELTKLRNGVVHDLSLYSYEFDSDRGGLWATPKPVVEVSADTAMQASMLMPEIIDAIFLAASRQFFQREPTVRPLTPQIAAVHRSIREERGWRKTP